MAGGGGGGGGGGEFQLSNPKLFSCKRFEQGSH